MMTMKEAQAIGIDKLKLHPKVLHKAALVAQEMGVERKHMPPMILALAIMGVAKATNREEIEGELTDALALVSKAEREWRMDVAAAKAGRLH